MRKIKTKSLTCFAEARNKGMDGKVKQEFIRYVGKEMNISVVRKISTSDVRALEVRGSLDFDKVHRTSSSLGINALIPRNAYVIIAD